jgi:hypothetical protein
MKLLLTRYVTTVLIIITVPLTLFLSCLLLLAPLAASTVSLCAFYFCRLIGKPFFAASGVHLAQSHQFHYRRAVFYSQLKSKVGNNLAKAAALRIHLNVDGAPIASRSHTHPSYAQPSRLSSSSLSLALPFPRSTRMCEAFRSFSFDF